MHTYGILIVTIRYPANVVSQYLDPISLQTSVRQQFPYYRPSHRALKDTNSPVPATEPIMAATGSTTRISPGTPIKQLYFLTYPKALLPI